MNGVKTDTHPEAAAVQLELLRNASVDQRLNLCCSMTHTARQQSKRAIARANPDLEPCELDVLFVRLNYGAELAARVRTYLERR